MMRELATDRAGLEILHLGDCFILLGSVPVGRIGFMAGGEVVILPVNHLVDGQDVVFSAGAGSKLAAAELGRYVAFEADCFDAATRSGWSVTVSGMAEVVESGQETARLDSLAPHPWGDAADRAWIRVRPVSVSGRRIPPPPAAPGRPGGENAR